jgi:hypothetical protein
MVKGMPRKLLPKRKVVSYHHARSREYFGPGNPSKDSLSSLDGRPYTLLATVELNDDDLGFKSFNGNEG